MSATTALREALNRGISSGTFIDTKIILYSRKDPSGRVSRPKALYANSHVLKTAPYFNDLLFGNFAESQLKDFKEAIDEEETAENYGYLSDSDLEEDEDETVTPSNGSSRSNVANTNPITVVPVIGLNLLEQAEECIEKGKVVKIPDIAFVTFQAFLVYLYTSAIEFAPFGSEENRRSRRQEIVDPSDDKVPRPSPKSVYRLADKYDVPALKNLALGQIRDGLTKCDIVGESFSRFASQYDEVRNLYAERLALVWIEDSTTEATRTSFEKKVCSFVEGDLDHAMEMLSALWDVANKDEDITAPVNGASSTVTLLVSPAHWGSVRRALIKSIRKGFFFDRKYWAKYSCSKSGDALRPVYFSSTIMDDVSWRMNTLVKYPYGLPFFISGIEGDTHPESDCEGDPSGVENQLKPGGKEQARVVLTRGSFSAWKSLFFYRCTDQILFAPLISQGVENRLNYIRANTVPSMPPPCSPKSIYVLANLLGIQPLGEKALADIKSKVTSSNVVSEVFSQVTAGQNVLMEIQCDLLISNFKDPKNVAAVKENIRHIPEGSLSHTAGALNLVFKKTFELKKKKRQPLGVKLRCSNMYCTRYANLVSYSCVGSSLYCTCCSDGYWMQCAGCGVYRSGVYSLCSGCGKIFV